MILVYTYICVARFACRPMDVQSDYSSYIKLEAVVASKGTNGWAVCFNISELSRGLCGVFGVECRVLFAAIILPCPVFGSLFQFYYY